MVVGVEILNDRRPWTTRTTTDHDEIREWVEARGAEPGCVTGTGESDGLESLRIDFSEAEDDPDLESISWDAFFEKFEDADFAFRYQDQKHNGEQSYYHRFVHREETGVADAVDEDVSVVAVGTEPVATDTEAKTGTEADAEPEDDRDADNEQETDPARGSTAVGVPDEVLDSEPRPEAKLTVGLVVDEIHEDAGGYDHWNKNDEYLVFRNDGDEPLALAGWTVENSDGKTYEFPDGFVLEPNRAVTLRTGSGTDTDRDLYWGSGRAVWKNTGDVLTVRTADGRRVIRESY